MQKIKIKNKLKIINQIQKIRSKNNINWMNILKVALKTSPKETIKILKQIHSSDSQINKLTKKL